MIFIYRQIDGGEKVCVDLTFDDERADEYVKTLALRRAERPKLHDGKPVFYGMAITSCMADAGVRLPHTLDEVRTNP